jgi:hypothetical protein
VPDGSTNRQSPAAHLPNTELPAVSGCYAPPRDPEAVKAAAKQRRSQLRLATVSWVIDAVMALPTTSTSFANPAVIVGRMFTDTFEGINTTPCPASSSPESSAPKGVIEEVLRLRLCRGLLGRGLLVVLDKRGGVPLEKYLSTAGSRRPRGFRRIVRTSGASTQS